MCRIAFIAVGALLSGCVIAQDREARAASGAVVDARSRKPLAGVSVFRVTGETRLVATTDSAGRFSVPALDRWYVTVPMGDAMGISKLVFRLQGYAEASVDTSTGIPPPRTPPLSSIVAKLHRKA
jgi:hypothetical protein